MSSAQAEGLSGRLLSAATQAKAVFSCLVRRIVPLCLFLVNIFFGTKNIFICFGHCQKQAMGGWTVRLSCMAGQRGCSV